MSQSQQFDTARAGGQSVASRVFGVGFRRETYANLVYLLVRFPLGIAYFTVLTTGLGLGVGLLPVLVGIPILAGVLAIGGYIGVVEAELLDRLRGCNTTIDPANPGELPVTEYLKTVATNPRNYVFILFGLASFFVGVPLFVAITVVFSLGVALVATPLAYWVPGIDYTLTEFQGTVGVGSVSIEAGSVAGGSISTLPEALAASVIGIVTCLAGLHAINLSARLLAGVTERLLTAVSE
jgi:hypothetical protein